METRMTDQQRQGKRCMLEVRQEHFPLLVASIRGVRLHTHTVDIHMYTHTHSPPHQETKIGLLIAPRQAHLKGQRRSLQRGTCLVIVTANRKTIGDLNSQMIKSALTSVTGVQDKGPNTGLMDTSLFFHSLIVLLCCIFSDGLRCYLDRYNLTEAY